MENVKSAPDTLDALMGEVEAGRTVAPERYEKVADAVLGAGDSLTAARLLGRVAASYLRAGNAEKWEELVGRAAAISNMLVAEALAEGNLRDAEHLAKATHESVHALLVSKATGRLPFGTGATATLMKEPLKRM